MTLHEWVTFLVHASDVKNNWPLAPFPRQVTNPRMISLDIRTLSPAGMPRVYPKWSNTAKHMRKRCSKGFPRRKNSSESIWSNLINSFQMLQLLLWTSRYPSAREVITFQPERFTWFFLGIECNELETKGGLANCLFTVRLPTLCHCQHICSSYAFHQKKGPGMTWDTGTTRPVVSPKAQLVCLHPSVWDWRPW